MLRIVQIRNEFFDDTTISSVLLDDGDESWLFGEGLEDRDRKLELYPERKVDGATAIPRGDYAVADTFSPRFQKRTLQLMDVPGFTGIRIHAGNDHTHSEGCILLGRKRDGRRITGSRLAVDALYGLVAGRLAAGEKVTWTVS